MIDDSLSEELGDQGADMSSVAQPDLGGVDFSTLQLRYVSDTYHHGDACRQVSTHAAGSIRPGTPTELRPARVHEWSSLGGHGGSPSLACTSLRE
ncbi:MULTISPECIES: hypothetical protein [Kitasatospora]|uniref:hypothetical protein n=1 Tax=Kitasatospora TaxID=2063 RepID=UPI000C70E302|nr:hypothetical protein [Kitasatospora sp. GP30]MDH6140159.1 hypothetical protein [Kitasatospora sp. GP30]